MTPLWRYFAVAGALLAMSGHGVAERSKNWAGKDGIPAYGDTVPPEAVQRGYRELDEHGIERREIAPAPTDEELAQKKQLDALRDEVRDLRRQQEEQDRRLLDLYSAEDDLLRACDGRIARLDGQAAHFRDERRRLEKQLDRMQASAAEAERSGQHPPATLLSDMSHVQSRIRGAESSIQAKEREKTAMTARCQRDLKRYRELHAGAPSKADPDGGKGSGASSPAESSVHCKSGPECERLWRIARDYAHRHATMPVDLDAVRIRATARPRYTGDIGITVARLGGGEAGMERIAIDVQCADTPDGEAFCAGPEVSAIRRGFRHALTGGALD